MVMVESTTAAAARANTLAAETDFGHVSIGEQQPWSSVWQRRKLSKRKLRQFFGKSAPVDVSLIDIEKYGLPALLQSNVPLCYFLYSLLEQYSAENLFFYLEVEQFQQHEFTTREELRKTGLQLYRAFIKCNSDFEVNIDASTRRPIRLAIDAFDPHCFDTAKDHIQRLLEPCYLQFISSDIYRRMCRDLEGKSLPYDGGTREVAISILVDYLDQNMPITFEQKNSALKGGPVGEVQRRNNLLRAMIHAFCQTRLHLDFFDTPGGETVKMTPEQMLPLKGGTPEASSSSTNFGKTSDEQSNGKPPRRKTNLGPQEGDLTKLIQLRTEKTRF